jgi:hypothetical protein
MIISFNPIIFESQDSQIEETLAKILIVLMESKNKNHFLDVKSIYKIFYNEDGKYIFESNTISKNHFSPQQQRSFKEFLNKKITESITSLYQQHLRQILIGNDENNTEIHPVNAYKIITERSKVIVENGINDWKFIRGLCQKYSSSGKTKRSSIYKLLDQAIKDEIIESENCGGVGELTKVIQRWIDSDRYQDIFKYKLMAIFDSDKQDSNGFVTPHTSQIKYLKVQETLTNYEYEPTDLIIWHILYKRKIENYMPLDILLSNINSITQAQKSDLLNKTHNELDFIEYSEANIGRGKSKIKDQFPEMFLASFSYREIEKRCEHHKIFLPEANELISEIEQILLKMAKII